MMLVVTSENPVKSSRFPRVRAILQEMAMLGDTNHILFYCDDL